MILLNDILKQNLFEVVHNPVVRVLIDALIELGIVTEAVCAVPNCRFPGEPFESGKGQRGGRPRTLTLDHITPKHAGGKDSVYNIRLAHKACNISNGWSDSPETRAKKSEAAKRREQDPEYRARREEARRTAIEAGRYGPQQTGTRRKLGERMNARYANMSVDERREVTKAARAARSREL